MAWIELHQTLPNHRKTLEVAELLNIHPAQCMGHIIIFWLWAIDNAPEGNLERISARTIARAAQWEGDPDQFVSALISVGFIDRTDDTDIIHDWMEYAGRLIEKRKEDAERKRQSREKQKEAPNKSDGIPEDVQRMSDGQEVDDLRSGDVTVPYRTKDINNTSATPLELIALNLLKSVLGYPFDYETDLAFIRTLAVDFPEMDLVGEIKKWVTYKMDKPLKQKSNPRLQLRNWMVKSREFKGKNKTHTSKSIVTLFPTSNEPPENWHYPPGYGEESS